MVEANPTSGYDDTIYVVMKTSYPNTAEMAHTRPICSHRTEESAEECAEQHKEPFCSTSVRCIGLNHD